MSVEARVYTRSNTYVGTLPWSGFQRQILNNAVGSTTLTAPASLITAAMLGDEPYVRPTIDGVESRDWYLIDDDGEDLADDKGTARDVTIAGRGVAACFEWAEVYPYDHTAGGSVAGLDPDYPFVNATPGKIMLDLINKAKARGAIPHLVAGFTATSDSSGAAWPTVYSKTWTLGDTLLKVLTEIGDLRWADWEMDGFTLRLYAPNTTLAQDNPNLVLHLGKEVKAGPRKRTRRAARSVLLAGGDEGALVEATDSAAVARLGRREGYESRSGITDTGVLTAVTQASLARQTTISEALTLELEPAAAPSLPRPGNFIRYDQRPLTSSTLEPLRLRSIAWNHGTTDTLSIELLDLWVDNDVRLERRIDALLGGSSANERVPQAKPQVEDDGIAPAAPGSVSVTPSAYYPDRSGPLPSRVPSAGATISWPAVTQNSDGTPYNDAGQYVISVLLPSRPNAQWGAERIARTNSTFVSGFVFGEQFQARVCTEDQNGNRSPWTYSVGLSLTATAGPIPQAPDPVLSTRLGVISATWGGRDRNNAVLNPWVVGVEVHLSTDPAFAVSDSTRLDFLGQAATSVIPGTPLGTDQYVRFVLVDYLGTRGVASNAVKVTPQPVVGDDILAGAVGSLQLADLAVTTAKLGSLAVTDAKIGSLSAGKITAGTLTADIILAGLIRTATSGSRVEISSTGLTSYNASNQAVVQFDNQGNATFAGTVTAAEVTSYLRAIYGSAQLVLRPDAFAQPDGTVVPAILTSLGQAGERGAAIITTYSEYLDGSRRYLSTYVQTPTSYGTGNTDQNTYMKLTTVGSPTAPTTADQIAASVTFGLGGRNQIQLVPNLTTSANLSSPGIRFLGTNPVGIRGLDGYIDIVNGTGAAWASIRAAGYLTQSARASKTAITEPDVDPLAIIRANPAMEWEYRPEVSEDRRRRIGPMADDLPDLLVHRHDGDQFVDNTAVLGLLWLAAQQLIERTREAVAA